MRIDEEAHRLRRDGGDCGLELVVQLRVLAVHDDDAVVADGNRHVAAEAFEHVGAVAEIAPNVMIGRHTHPGPESGYLLEGEFVLMIDGQPPKPLKAGESYQIPSGAIHDAKSGAGGAKVLAVYIVRKGEPLATPAK
jgi:quercetin dioxygenase-like cupin family protein